MKTIRYFIILIPAAILCGILFTACNKKQKNAIQKDAIKGDKNSLLAGDLKSVDFYDYDYILVGSYGGFTGGKKMHRIDADGVIQGIRQMKPDAPVDTVNFYKISKENNKQLHEDVKESGVATLHLDDPGNMTYFITLGKGGTEHTVKWGKSKDAVPESIKKLHNILLKHCTKE